MDELRGAFCQLSNGEEAFLRLKARGGLSEGAAIRVKVQSEARTGKLARVATTDEPLADHEAFDLWRATIGAAQDTEIREDREAVEAAFDDVMSPNAVLPRGGTLHIARTRALTAIDVDTSGRIDKSSAGARALAVNRDAITEMVRQIGLRGLGGLFVLDCVSPINADAATRLRDTAREAFQIFGFPHAKVLKPSVLGLLEASTAWRVRPIDEILAETPDETTLLFLLRALQREADARTNAFFELCLNDQIWPTYLARKEDVDQALAEGFSGRVTVVKTDAEENEVRRK
ncbi:MAG: ribonuclease E/G [Henriciella sp.]|nr:ribonuclease E/G [Henriciella sp.]